MGSTGFDQLQSAPVPVLSLFVCTCIFGCPAQTDLCNLCSLSDLHGNVGQSDRPDSVPVPGSVLCSVQRIPFELPLDKGQVSLCFHSKLSLL